MRILGQTIALGDIDDVENFIQNSITKSRVKLTNDERKELVSEGLAIMLELWHKYDPNKDTGTAPRADGTTQGVASFAGYANFLLGRKLGDAWHRMNAHHILRTDPDGKKRWHYLDTALPYSPDIDDDQPIRIVGDFVRAA
jgi:hypothetical protein